ncbi:MAG TPA: TM1802 family CRISPR-associated protein [Bacteroidales bacterium]|nr:TM1802 family CRISPR-associated protein [Bacteroidales bacterium]
MLDTLLKIGEWQSKGISLLETELMDLKPESDTPLVLPIVIDLDQEKIYYDTENISEFDSKKTPKEIMLLNTFSARSHKTYLAVDAGHLYYLEEALFGKEGKEIGDFKKHVDSNFSKLKSTKFYEILEKAFSLSEFRDKFDIEQLKEFSSSSSKIEVAYLKVKDTSLGIEEPTPIFEVEGFKEFRDEKYFPNEGKRGFCYVTTETKDDVVEMSVDDRKSMFKMFQGTSLNYAVQYDSKKLAQNFQVSKETLRLLEEGDRYVRENMRTNIAGEPHIIIPEFPSWGSVEIDFVLKKVATQSDLLFKSNVTEEIFQTYATWSEEIYWVNFIAIHSDGQSFKTLNEIKDVSEPFLNKLIKTFREVDWAFRELPDVVNWESVKNEYGKASNFNLNTVYGLVPVRQEKETKNVALQLFKAILEQRKIENEQLFQFFSELILCHYFSKYNSYTNVYDYSRKGSRNRKDYFTWAVRDCVFKYLAFIQVLKKLNLIDMEQQETITAEEMINDFDQKIENFFSRMDFNDQQKAMFFLGQMLNAVTYLQKDKNKTVIDKVNYNGMDRDDIVRLRVDLFKKAKQYGHPEKVKFKDSHFGQYFNFEHWNMNPQEAVFFILTGYSFGIVKQADSNSKND